MARAVPWHGSISIRTAIGWSSYKIPAPAGSEARSSVECLSSSLIDFFKIAG